MSSRLLLVGFAGIMIVTTGAITVSLRGAPGPRSTFGDAVGHRVLDFSFRDIDGERGRLYDLLGSGPVVVAMRDGGCPVAQKYGAELARIAGE